MGKFSRTQGYLNESVFRGSSSSLLVVVFNYGTGGNADDRDVISGSSFVGCPNLLRQKLNHVDKYPGDWGRAPK